MYEELINRLREYAADGYLVQTRIGDAITEAADAIEELQKPVEERVKEYLRIKGRCPTCKRSSDVLNDGTTNCPIEKCYVLPLDGFCHLYEPVKAEEDE